jgi:hypothetical protein
LGEEPLLRAGRRLGNNNKDVDNNKDIDNNRGELLTLIK